MFFSLYWTVVFSNVDYPCVAQNSVTLVDTSTHKSFQRKFVAYQCMSFLMGVIYKTANEGLLSRVSPLTLYYTLRLMSEIVIEIKKKRSVSVQKMCRRPCYDCQGLLYFNPLKPELNPIFSLLALLGAHHFLHVSRIRVKSLTLR